jgi:predicted nucleic acid-binding protein
MMGSGGSLEILVDTNVATWTWMTNRKKSERAREKLERFGDALTGKTLMICGQTRAELLQLALGRPEETQNVVRQTVDLIPYVPLDRDVQARYAELWLWARDHGHAIHQPIHAADRWIAAAAMQYNIPLASEDRIFANVPHIELIGPVRAQPTV